MKKLQKGVNYIGVGIGAVIVDEDGKVLMAKRGEKAKNEKGKWEFPGGSVEFGETMRDTIIREVREELGIEIEVSDHLPAIDHIIPDEGQHWVTSGYMARITKGEPKIMEPEKCSEIGWFKFSELKKMEKELSIASQQYIPFLEKIDLKN